MANKKNKTRVVGKVNEEVQTVSNEPVITEEMVAKYSNTGKEFKKVGIITVALIVLLVVLWLILK